MSIVVFGIIFAGLGFIIVGFSTSIVFVLLAFIFRSMAYQAYIPAYRAFQADQIPHMIRGKTMGRIQSAFNVGAIFGPLVGSAIYEVVSNDWIRILGIDYVFYGGGIPFLVAGVFTLSQVIVATYILRSENAK
jgi:MFS family permease